MATIPENLRDMRAMAPLPSSWRPKRSATADTHARVPDSPPLTGTGIVYTPNLSSMNPHIASANMSEFILRSADARAARLRSPRSVAPGRTQFTFTPISSRIPVIAPISDMTEPDMVLDPTRFTLNGIASPFAAYLPRRASQESITPCMKSPAALPSSRISVTFTPGCLLSASAQTETASSPIIPGGQAVITAMSVLPPDIAFSNVLSSAWAPPNTMSDPSMHVQYTSGARYAGTGTRLCLAGPMALTPSSCTVKWAQLLGAWRTAVNPDIDVQVLDAPEKAHPPRGARVSARTAEKGIFPATSPTARAAAHPARAIDLLPRTTSSSSLSERGRAVCLLPSRTVCARALNVSLMSESGKASTTVFPILSASMNARDLPILATIGTPTASENLSTLDSSSGSPRLLKTSPPIRSGS